MPGYAPLEISGKRTVNGRVIVDSEFLVDNFALSQEASTHTFGSNGDLFTSQEDAVLAFGLKYLPIAQSERQEYGASIKAGPAGTFYIDSITNSAMNAGKSSSKLADWERNILRKNEKEWKAGYVHIHWNKNPTHPEFGGYTNFSSQDLIGNFAGEELYLIGPHAGVRKAVQYNSYPDSDGRYRNYYQPDDEEIFYIYYGG